MGNIYSDTTSSNLEIKNEINAVKELDSENKISEPANMDSKIESDIKSSNVESPESICSNTESKLMYTSCVSESVGSVYSKASDTVMIKSNFNTENESKIANSDSIIDPEIHNDSKNNSNTINTLLSASFNQRIGNILSFTNKDIIENIYVITSDTIHGYFKDFESAKSWVDAEIKHHLIGHYLRHKQVEKLKNTSKSPVVYSVSVYERDIGILFESDNIICQYNVWKASKLESFSPEKIY